MALTGYEVITVVAVLAIIFIWGPGKLPEMAKAIGEAKREFDKASGGLSTLSDPMSVLKSQTSTPATVQTTQPSQDPIVVAAKSLGINTEGKTKEDLAREIVGRTTKTTVALSEKETPAASAGQ